MRFADLRKGYALMNEGQWVGDLPAALFDGVRFKVRRLWNPDYQALHDRLAAEVSELSEADNARRITTACLTETCLVGWDGVEDAFSVEAAKQLADDPDIGSTFISMVMWASGRVADRVRTQLEADEKN